MDDGLWYCIARGDPAKRWVWAGCACMKKIIAALLSVVLIALFGLLFYMGRRSPRTGTESPLAHVSADVPLKSAEFTPADQAGAFERVPVFPRLSGCEVVKIWADAGAKVREGQVLAEMDDAPLETELERRQDAFRQAEKNLRDALAGAQATDRPAASLDEARSGLADIQARMGYRYVIAPADGIVLERSVNIGSVSRADTVMFVIGRPLAEPSGGSAPASND